MFDRERLRQKLQESAGSREMELAENAGEEGDEKLTKRRRAKRKSPTGEVDSSDNQGDGYYVNKYSRGYLQC